MSQISINVVKEFLQYLTETKNSSAKKVAGSQEELNKLADFINSKGKSLLSLDREDLIDYLKFLRSESKENGKDALATLQDFYQFALDKTYLQHNPATNLSKNLASPKAWQTMPKFLSKTEIDILFAAPDLRSDVGIRDLAMLQLLYVTGLRVSELIAVKLTDIDLAKGTLTYLGKSNKERDIALGKAQDYLTSYLKSRKRLLGKRNSEALFVNEYGEEMTRHQFWRVIIQYGKSTGLGHITPHMLRHTFATHLLEHGADNASVEMLDSKESSKTTQPTYIADERLKSVYQRFNPRSR